MKPLTAADCIGELSYDPATHTFVCTAPSSDSGAWIAAFLFVLLMALMLQDWYQSRPEKRR